MNAYLQFIESGEMGERFPQTKGRGTTISLVGQYPLSERATNFLAKAKAAVEQVGVSLEFRLLHES